MEDNRQVNLQMIDTNSIQATQYLQTLNTFLLCYGFTLSPNLYSMFTIAFALVFLGKNNVYLFAFTEIAVACIPIAYHYMQDNYVLLNMLTYFPYVLRENYHQILANVVIVWALFIALYAIQFYITKKNSINNSMGTMLAQLRRDNNG